MLQTCDQENAQAEIANKDLGLIFWIKKRERFYQLHVAQKYIGFRETPAQSFEYTL